MKRKVLSLAAIAGFALLAFSVVSIAQPVTRGGGLSRVLTGSGLTGSGTTSNPLNLDTTYVQRRVSGTCAAGNAIRVVNADGTVTCEASGGITGTGTANTIAKWTGASSQGNSSITDDGSTVTLFGTVVNGTLNATNNVVLGNAAGDPLTVNATSTFNAPTTVTDFRGTSITTTDIGTQDNYTPAGLATATTILLNPASALTITGITGGAANRELTLCNIGASSVTLTQDNALSLAANRFYLPGALAMTIQNTAYWNAGASRECVVLLYNGTASRWTVKSSGLTSMAVLETTSQLYSGGTTNLIGAVTANANVTLGNEAVDILDFNGDLAKFGATDGAQFFYQNTLNTGYSTNAVDALYLNWAGYQNGTTQFRNLDIRDGKNGRIALFTGSNKNVTFDGGIDVAGQAGAASLSVTGTATLYGGSTTIGNATTDALTVNATTTVKAFGGTVVTPVALPINGSSCPTNCNNDYNPTDLASATLLNVSAAATSTITGIAGGYEGRELTIYNNGAELIYLFHNDGNSLAANRIFSAHAQNVLLEAENSAVLRYKNGMWRVLTKTGRFQASWYVQGGFVSYDTSSLYGIMNFGNAEADEINLYGKPYTRGVAPALETCGTGATIIGNDKAGSVTMGSTGAPSACTLAFNTAWSTNAPICTVSRTGTIAASVMPWVTSSSTAAITVSLYDVSVAASAGVNSFTFNYHCVGRL